MIIISIMVTKIILKTIRAVKITVTLKIEAKIKQ